jgi:HNH endonuclease
MPKMWSKNNPLPRERLIELLDYDPATGEFRWRVKRNSHGGGVKIGTLAGCLDRQGYRYIGIDGRFCQAHTLAWFYVYNQWPILQIDHKNMVADDNRIDNLREATMSDQRANQRVRKDSITGVKGVQKTRRGTYRARIRKGGVGYELGHYRDIADAVAAYAKAATELFGEFART